eukprot:TRINITY_DN1060_c0_g1::TRINITY_DN1060_c0_g1_i1::g.30034::m.30034 TRINITY_DN1060_c0_g1::TRINITY_DN1060_c0_g1_i1::g.30034  ORF type:complete len:1894 (+),score=487.47,sp/Q6WWW4/UPL3_ARATH/36.71/3e-119,sp/Q6WWW4/UPL3_ARATH/32.33/2e-102,HECT/PF00632.20/1.8e-75,HEAT_2/PF13646.1/4.1e+02,HEAT_2/PF13646.1/0.12,HEAT_2/PF13646.1/6.4,HEAT_2/PF13646.1/1.9e+03,Neurochondrin/PF05536.6/1.9e+03,Neurochondrin/PF05536.6/4.9e-06,Arm/PF00514.18/1.2e+02,Arm/PF00514.18/22,Arm/PF00514.18/1.1e+03,Arm/PF00514.18/8.5e+02,
METRSSKRKLRDQPSAERRETETSTQRRRTLSPPRSKRSRAQSPPKAQTPSQSKRRRTSTSGPPTERETRSSASKDKEKEPSKKRTELSSLLPSLAMESPKEDKNKKPEKEKEREKDKEKEKVKEKEKEDKTSPAKAGEESSSQGEANDGLHTLQNLLRRLGGLDEVFGNSGMFGGSARYRTLLADLKSDDMIKQMESLNELCDMLAMATEETLGSFPLDQFVPILAEMLNREESSDLMLLASRAFTHLMEAVPGSISMIVHSGAVPSFVNKLLTIEYIDLAEQSLQALEKIAADYPQPVLRAGGLMACLSFIDFFATGVQRVSVSLAAKICRQIPLDCADMALDVVPNLINILSYSDQKTVEHAATCLKRISESLRKSEPHLKRLMDAGVVSHFMRVIAPAEMPTGRNEVVFECAISTMGSLAAGCTSAAATMLREGISPMIAKLLSETSSSGSEHTLELLQLATSLLPPLPSSHNATLLAKSQRSSVSRLLSAGLTSGRLVLSDLTATAEKEPESDEKKKLFEDNPNLVRKFDEDLFQVLVDVFNTTVNSSVRHSILIALAKMIHFSPADILKDVLRSIRMSSFFASLLTSKDWAVVLATVQMVDELLDKLPDIFSVHFQREGVMHELERISNLSLSSSPRASPASTPTRPGGASSPMTPSRANELKQTAIQTAKSCLSKFKVPSAGAPQTLVKLQTLAQNMSKEGSMQQLAELLKDEDGISSFEFLNSGLIQALVDHLTFQQNSNGARSWTSHEPGYEEVMSRLADFTEAFLQNDAKPLACVIKKTNEALAISEHFPASIHEVSGRSSSSIVNALRMLTQPFKLRLQRDQSVPSAQLASSSSLRDYSSNIVLVEPLATVGAITDFLREKVKPEGGSKARGATAAAIADDDDDDDGEKDDDMLGTGEGEAEGEGEGMDDDDGEGEGAAIEGEYDDDDGEGDGDLEDELNALDGDDDDDLLASHMTHTGERVHELTLPPRPTTAENVAASEDKEKEKSSRKKVGSSRPRSASEKDKEKEKSSEGKSASSASASSSTATPSTSTSSSASPASPSSEVKLLVTMGGHVLDPNMSIMQAVHRYGPKSMSLRDSEQQQQATSSSSSASASAPSASTESTSAADKEKAKEEKKGEEAQGEMAAPDLPMRTPTSASASTSNTGTNGAASHEEDDDDDVSCVDRLMWTKIYTVQYALVKSSAVSASASESSSSSASASTSSASASSSSSSSSSASAPSRSPLTIPSISSPSALSTAEALSRLPVESVLWDTLPDPLRRVPVVHATLTLLRILYWLNRAHATILADRSRKLSSVHGDAVVGPVEGLAVPLSLFINSKLSAKLSRLLTDVLRLCSGSFPAWCEALARHTPFLLPYDVRSRYLQCTAMGLSRALHRLQEVAGNELNSREVRIARIQRQKVRISRTRALESAVRVMELYGKSRAMVEVEYFEESGTGLGPTLEFYTLVCSELQKRACGLWHDTRTASGSDMVSTECGLYPRPRIFNDATTEAPSTTATTSTSTSLTSTDSGASASSTTPDDSATANKSNNDASSAPSTAPSTITTTASSQSAPSSISALPKGAAAWKFLGRFVGKALLDDRLLDLHFSPTFFFMVTKGVEPSSDVLASGSLITVLNALRNWAGNSPLKALHDVDPALATVMHDLLDLVIKKKAIEADPSLSDASKAEAIGALRMKEARVEDLALDFTLPGYPDVPLKDGGSDISVDMANLEEYVQLVLVTMLCRSVKDQVLAFRDGLSQVISVDKLAAFSAEEFDEMLCGKTEAWDLAYLLENTKCDHGYSHASPAVRYFLDILTSLSDDHRVAFLKFATGSPRLPVGGLKALTPKLTIVKRNPDGDTPVDSYLPTVMTCANYVKLPDYSTPDIMRARLLTAITEGQGSFHLS